MLRKWGARSAIALAAVAAFAVDSLALGPDRPAPRGSYDAVVRVYDGGGFGTGSVIAKGRFGDDWVVCVLTADHNVTGGGNTIAFHNLGDADAFSGQIFQAHRRGPNGQVDLAVLGVRIPNRNLTAAQSAFMNNLNALALLRTGNPVGSTFTMPGYGLTGDLINDQFGNPSGYLRRNNSGEIKRYGNNSFTVRRNVSVPGAGGYFYDSVGWELDGAGFDVPGEMTSYGGDSGAPYLMAFADTVGGLRVFRDGIMGVHTLGNNSGFNGFYPFPTSSSAGVYLNDRYIDWIVDRCHAIPEPASIMALLMGSGLLAALKRRR